MKRALLLAATAALGGAVASPAATPVVRADAPAGIGFGDAFTYVVEARGEAVSIVAPTAPFTRLGPPRLERAGTLVRLTQRVACLDARCLAAAPTKRVTLPPPRARIGSRTIAGEPVSVSVRSRVTRTRAAAGDEAYRRDTSLPAVAAAAGVAWLVPATVAIGLVLVLLVLLRPSRTRRRSAVDAVPRAIRLLRESATRDAADRRRAAALLARTAEPRAQALAEKATTAAWARPSPAGEDALRLAALAQRELT